MLNRMLELRQTGNEIALRASVDLPDPLVAHLRAGPPDIAAVYAPQYETGVTVGQLFQETLVLIGSSTAYRHSNILPLPFTPPTTTPWPLSRRCEFYAAAGTGHEHRH